MRAFGIIFANIFDSSLGQLTHRRSMASMPFGGRYRQIDFALSNMSDAGIRRIGVIASHNYQSLMAHIGSGEEWDLELQEGGLEFLLPYSQGQVNSYQGKLDALASFMHYLQYADDDSYVVLADAGVLYNIDVKKVLESHIDSGKDITILCKAGVADGKKRLDLAVRQEEDGTISDLTVKYAAPAGDLASMGMFIISKKLLVHYVEECVARNLYHLERDMILPLYRAGKLSVNVYRHDGIVLYNESTEEYYKGNLAIINKEVRHDLFGGTHPIFTKVRDRVPSYYGENCQVENCTVADGCMLHGSVSNSVLYRQVTVGEGARIEDCVIMNDTVVGENCELKCVILDKDVTVTPGSRLIGTPKNPVIIGRGETV